MGLAVMKPVRTGFLANLPQVMRDALASTGIRKPDTEWALDYLWDIPEVSVATRHLRASPAANVWRSARSIWIFPLCWRRLC